MNGYKDIILAVDYHAENMTVRELNLATGQENVRDCPTSRGTILRLVEEAAVQAGRQGGRVKWLMESTTGWARVRELIGGRVDFVLVNVLQMPLPPKAHRRKTDKVDTARMLREELNGTLPRAFQPDRSWRQARRVVDARTDLVRRQTSDRRRDGHIGGGGTDERLRFLVIEATKWLREIPRYRGTYERVVNKRGKNVAKLVLARLFLRSLHKMLRDNVRFDQAPGLPASGARAMAI